jgi:hypothetical protein
MTRLRQTIPITDRLIAGPLGMVWRHWYRTPGGAGYGNTLCAYQGCHLPGTAHLRWCGEWRRPRRERTAIMVRRIVDHLTSRP